jgi:hypothetical protein
VLVVMTLGAVVAPAANPVRAQDPGEIAKRRAEFEREDDPFDKARRFPRLGEELLKRIRQQVRQEAYDAALATLQEYRDLARVAFEGLKNSGVDAEKKPSGFRHLQIHLRRSIRDLGQTITALPVPEREPFVAIQHELEQINRALLEMLFPRRPTRQTSPSTRSAEVTP